MVTKIIFEALSFIASLCLWISASRRTQRSMLLWQTAECLIQIVAMLLVNQISGSTMLFICAGRNIALDLVRKRKIKKGEALVLIVSALAQAVFGILTYAAWYDAITIAASVLFSLGLFRKEIVFTKWNLIVNLLCWTAYSFFIQGWVMMASYIIMAATAGIDILRYRHSERRTI